MTVIVADFLDAEAKGSTPGPEQFPRPNWDRAPWSRWSFLNMRQLFPSGEIRRGVGAPSHLPRRPLEIDRLTFRTGDGRSVGFGDMLAATGTNGFLLLQNGRIVVERYFGGMAPETEHLGQALSSGVVAATAGALVGAGRLDPEAPVTDYLPELSRGAWRGARVRHVMDMTSGVRFSDDPEDPASDRARLAVAGGWRPAPHGAGRRAWPGSIVEQMLRLSVRDDDHGARHAYRAIEAEVLGLIIARVEGRPFAETVSRRIWAPMGAEADASVTLDPMGVAMAGAGISATLRDYGRFGQMLLGGGEIAGRRVLPAAWVERLRRGASSDGGEARAEDARARRFPNGCFRDMFWIEERGRETLVLEGDFGQLLYVSPEADMVAVKLSSWASPRDVARADLTLRALRALAVELS